MGEREKAIKNKNKKGKGTATRPARMCAGHGAVHFTHNLSPIFPTNGGPTKNLNLQEKNIQKKKNKTLPICSKTHPKSFLLKKLLQNTQMGLLLNRG